MKPRFASTIALVLMFGVALWSTQAFSVANVAITKHNLSISGPGGIKSTAETEVCVFCHVPHNASTIAPLWNRANPTGTYTPYSSSTAKGNMGQPNGTSLLCLSCHDGTIALGELLSRGATKVPMLGVTTTGMLPSTSSSLLGRDLSDDHPISIAYTAALATGSGGELVSPAALTGKVKLDKSGQMQCSSCHDPHDNTIPKFLVMSNTASALCVTCHTKAGWSGSSHATSTATWTVSGTNPWPHTSEVTVAANACENCHQPHTAAGKARLLNSATDETNCYTCHTGTVAGKVAPVKNMQTEMTKISGHAVGSYTGLHDPVEANLATNRHVECADCHNPHQTNAAAGTTSTASGLPVLPGSLKGVKGVTIAGAATPNANNEYEVCLRCHGDSTGKNASSVTRVVPSGSAVENNVRLEFHTTNASYHPVAGIGKGTNVPSLIGPGLTTSSIITCSSCHSNDTVGGPKGPHGSSISPLLERRYDTTKVSNYSGTRFALCYKCHSETTVRNTNGNSGSWVEHDKHLGKGIACSDCHDPHGVSTNKFLINFNKAVALPSGSVGPSFTPGAAGRGSCTTDCHGKDHNPKTY